MATVSSPDAAERPSVNPWQRASVSGRWRAAVFAPAGDGVRSRLGSDAWRVGLSIVGLSVVYFAYRNNASVQTWVVSVTGPPPSGIAWLLTLLAFAGTFGVTGLLLVTSLVSRRREVLIDVVGAAGVAIVVCVFLRWLFGTSGGADLSATYPGVNTTIPLPVLSVAVAMALAARPYLSRSCQRLCYLAFTLGALCIIVDAKGLPLSVAASILVGWGAAAAVRLVTGTPSGLPGAGEVATMVRELGVSVRSVAPQVRQSWGAARYDAVGDDGSVLRVSVYGRDTRDAELANTIGRAIAYRDEGHTLFVTRLQQAEHEAYVTLRARATLNSGAPELVAAGCAGPSKDGVVVAKVPPGSTLRDALQAGVTSPEPIVRSLLTSVARLAEQSISHGSIDQDHVVVRADGAISLDDFLRGTSSASPQRSARDLASAMTCAALAADVDTVLRTTKEVVGIEGLGQALPYLQAAALPGALSRELKERKELLDELRAGGAAMVGIDAPELAKLTRVSVSTLVIAIGTLIGGWALIGVLLNVANSFSTIRGADLLWVAVVAVLSCLCYPSSAMSCEGSIPTRLPFSRLVVLEVSNTFSGLAAGTVAVLGARVRFFQKQGQDATSAVSSGVLVSTASWIVKGGLFLIALPFAWSSFQLTTNPSGGNGHARLVSLMLAVIIGVGIALGVVLFVPRYRSMVRKKLAPKTEEVKAHLAELAKSPLKLTMVFGGCVAGQLLVATALGASLHAFDAHLTIAELLVVLTLGSVLGGISPVPGGMGVVEAGMIIGLASFGIPDDIAVSAVFVQRLFTAYLPPIVGWFALVWLRRQDLL